MNALHRNPGIDILRGLSIFFVIMLHFNIHLNIKESYLRELLPSKLFNTLFWSGYYGVVMFFTLSGYLITTTVLKRWTSLSAIHLKHYYWLRFARIIPTLSALVLVLLILHFLGIEVFRINEQKVSAFRAAFAALTFHVNWLEMEAGYLPGNWDVLWTISVEEVFYIFFPLLCILLRHKLVLICILIFLLVFCPWSRTHLFLDNELGDRNNFNYLDCIALGCAVAAWRYHYPIAGWIKLVSACLGLAMIIAVLVFRAALYRGGWTGLGLDLTLLSGGVSLLLVWMHGRGEKDGKIPGFSWLRKMGQYSYEIYLTHMFIVTGIALAYKHFQWEQAVLPYLLLAGTLLCYMSGMFVFRYFSDPVNQWLRRRWHMNKPWMQRIES